MEYGFLAFAESPPDNRQPIFIRTIRQSHHDTETDVPLDETITTLEYSDGFGRLLQTRTQAEDVLFDDPTLPQPIFGHTGLPADQNTPPADTVGTQASAAAPFVTESGWQVYDNKGRVVEKFEPFFSLDWPYAPPLDRQFGQKATMHYDPRGQVIRTVNPDGSEQRVIYGVPGDLAHPFPELTQVMKDPTLPSALALRKQFPTPAALATASVSTLQAARIGHSLSDAKLVELQRLAVQSIGTKEPARLRGLTFEQEQLIEELTLIHKHLEKLETEMTQIVTNARDGQILMSIPGIGPIPAATMITMIGTLANFERPSQLKAYFGWAPAVKQSGYSLDSARLSPRGTRQMKQMISVAYGLLKKDHETLSKLAPGAKQPEPELYDPEVHRKHRSGHREQPAKLIQLPTY